nr:venom polypeptide precursor [Doratifera vulnerans]
MHLSCVKLVIALAALATVAAHHVARRSVDDYQCKGVYDASMFARLERLCQDCYNVFREPIVYSQCMKDCFTGDFFKGCVEVLQETDQLEVFKTYIKKLHGADPML